MRNLPFVQDVNLLIGIEQKKKKRSEIVAQNIDSEFRAYGFIEKSLKDTGWDIRNPLKHSTGEVYTQNEVLKVKELNTLLKGRIPENVVKVSSDVYWIIEAKKNHFDLKIAIKEAEEYAEMINKSNNLKCLFITGIAGTEENTFIVETYFLEKKYLEKNFYK